MRVYTNNENIANLIETTLQKIKGLIDVSSIIGEKVETEDGTIIIPISRVSVGYVVGGGEYADLSSRRVANHFPMAGGSSGGVSISPVGFLVYKDGNLSFVNIEDKTLYQTILNTFNKIVEKMGKEKNNEV